METAEFFRQYTEAYDRVMSSVSTYRTLKDLHKEALKGRSKILESGCGSGTLAVELLKQGSIVYALDQNQAALDRLKTEARGYETRLETYCQDAHQLLFEDEFFDGVSSMLVLPFMGEPMKYLREHARVLRKGGIFVVSGPDKKLKEDVDRIMREWKGDQARQGTLGDLKEDWEKYEKYTRENVEVNVKNWFGREKLSQILEEYIGLKVNTAVSNPIYYGTGYVIVAEKRSN